MSDRSIIVQKEYDNYRVQKNSIPKLHEVIRGTKQRFIVKTLCQGCILAITDCSNWVRLRF
jgi:hypothetical protein